MKVRARYAAAAAVFGASMLAAGVAGGACFSGKISGLMFWAAIGVINLSNAAGVVAYGLSHRKHMADFASIDRRFDRFEAAMAEMESDEKDHDPIAQAIQARTIH